MTSPAAASKIRRELLRWYDAKRRRLPWREHPSPYRTWVSEIMLQQTQVATVLPYYERFLSRFPDVESLANAKQEEVLRLWAGLGYYSRARNLQRAAQEVLSKHGGRFPEDYEAILDLPGIGRYTAGAILSIAFGKPYPVLDGNVMRVFARLFSIRSDIKAGKTQKEMWELAERLVDPARPGDWNQALMELGAIVCVPEAPRCGDCPLSRDCAAKRDGLQDSLPVVPQSREPVSLAWTCLWMQQGSRILLWKRAENERFLPGHWSFPEKRHMASEIGQKLATVRHTITYHRISVDVHAAKTAGDTPEAARWVPAAQADEYLVSSLWLKMLKAVEKKNAGRKES